MQVSCPSCGTKYVFPSQEARPGVKARCKRCQVVFSVKLEKRQSLEASSKPPAGGETVEKKGSEGSSKPSSEKPPLDMSVEQPPATSRGDDSPWGGPSTNPSPKGEGRPAGSAARPATGQAYSPSPSRPPGGEQAPSPSLGVQGPAAPSAGSSEEREGALGQGVRHSSLRQVRPAGVSAIRAQGMKPETPPPSTDLSPAEEEPEDRGSGWLVRGQGGTRSFRNLESVRAWMTANSASDVLISSDGVEWKSPDEIAGLIGAAAGQPTGQGVDEPAPPLVAGAFSRPRPIGERAGFVWTLAAIASSLALLFAGGLTVHNVGLVDLGGLVPFEDLGLQRLVWAPAASFEDGPDSLKEARYRAAVKQGDAAREDGRLFDAISSYGRALEALEGSEALQGLIASYEALGDDERAGEARRRLTGLKQAGPNDDE